MDTLSCYSDIEQSVLIQQCVNMSSTFIVKPSVTIISIVALFVLWTNWSILFSYENFETIRRFPLTLGTAGLFAPEEQQLFAVFSCSTPANNSHRGFDYAFYLPLTTLAWHRIGFKSVILITGDRQHWHHHPVLSYILECLQELNATVLFIDGKPENLLMLSQTSRLFVANMKVGNENDYFITSDADLWPLNRTNFAPRVDKSLVILHSHCCGKFVHNNRSYRMIPMAHIGATGIKWREIMNAKVDDADSILEYFQSYFGSSVRDDIFYGSSGWDLDQKLISLLVHEWMARESNRNLVYELPDLGLRRIDRNFWIPHRISPQFLHKYNDAHMIAKAPENWERIRPLVSLMYGSSSWQWDWTEKYVANFRSLLHKD